MREMFSYNQYSSFRRWYACHLLLWFVNMSAYVLYRD
jgi:hypothetical protein